jgi:hypothetical protein
MSRQLSMPLVCISPSCACLFSVSLVKRLLKSFAHFLTGLFSYCCFESSIHILDTSALSDGWFANIFLQFVICIFILKRIFHRIKVFRSNEVQIH